MEHLSLGGVQSLLPLLLHMDQRPLSAAIGEVLQAGEHEQLPLRHQIIRVQVTPSGIAASSTVTS